MNPEIVTIINTYLNDVMDKAKKSFEYYNLVVQSGEFLTAIEVEELARQNQRNIAAYKIKSMVNREGADPKSIQDAFIDNMTAAGTGIDVYTTAIRLVEAYRRAHKMEPVTLFSV